MEVHHGHHAPKNWKEYFTEFLMLFAAVTLGFIAENYREHYIEEHRAQEYIGLLKADVEKNIHYIDSVINRDKALAKKLDSAFLYLAESEEVNLDSLHSNLPPNLFRFMSKNDTYEQMKSSGSLRYIKDEQLLHLITEYSSATEAAESRSTSMEMEYVNTQWPQVINRSVTNAAAIVSYQNARSGYIAILGIDDMSKEIMDEDAWELFGRLDQVKKEKIIVQGEALKQLQKDILPSLARRQGLLVNTMKFMFRAKEKGEVLLKHINEKSDHS
jgi:hypothetical protein